MLRKKISVVTAILVVACIISGCSKTTNIHVTSQPTEVVSYEPQPTMESASYELEPTPDQNLEKEKEDVDNEIPKVISKEVQKEENQKEIVVYDTDYDPIDDTISGWYYNQLTRNQKVIYAAIQHDTDIMQNEYVKFKEANKDDLERAVTTVILDNNYIVQLECNYYKEQSEEQSISAKITAIKYDSNEKQIRQAEKEADRIIRDKIKEGTEEEVIWQIYKYLTKNIKYDDTTKKKHTMDLYGALIKKNCVCAGYAKAFSYLCNRIEGLKAITVYSDEHAWNYVQLSNKRWYAIDATWGRKNKKQYFMRGADFLDDHVPRSDFEVPVLNNQSLCPDSEYAKKVKKKLKEDISVCEKSKENIDAFEEIDETDEMLYGLYDEVQIFASEILEKINDSLLNSYINTEEFVTKYNELGSKIEELNSEVKKSDSTIEY